MLHRLGIVELHTVMENSNASDIGPSNIARLLPANFISIHPSHPFSLAIRRHRPMKPAGDEHFKSSKASIRKNYYHTSCYCLCSVEVIVTADWLIGYKKKSHTITIALTTLHVTLNSEQVCNISFV